MRCQANSKPKANSRCATYVGSNRHICMRIFRKECDLVPNRTVLGLDSYTETHCKHLCSKKCTAFQQKLFLCLQTIGHKTTKASRGAMTRQGQPTFTDGTCRTTSLHVHCGIASFGQAMVDYRPGIKRTASSSMGRHHNSFKAPGA